MEGALREREGRGHASMKNANFHKNFKKERALGEGGERGKQHFGEEAWGRQAEATCRRGRLGAEKRHVSSSFHLYIMYLSFSSVSYISHLHTSLSLLLNF